MLPVQGMHVLLEDLGGFGQVAADLLGEVRDEYTRTPLLLFAYRKPEVQQQPRQASTCSCRFKCHHR